MDQKQDFGNKHKNFENLLLRTELDLDRTSPLDAKRQAVDRNCRSGEL